MSTYRDLLRWGRKELNKAYIPDGDLDAWYLMEYVFELDRAHYFLRESEEAGVQEEEYRRLISLRCGRIPLQHLTHQAWFMGLEFYVDDRVLVPRQDTEILVEEAVRRLGDGQRLLDMCTGSGCILLSILSQKPCCKGTGVDLSADALEVARLNGRRLNITADFQQSDLFADIGGRYEMIVSNPPYIPTGVIPTLEEEVRSYDPTLALDGGGDGLSFYRRIVEQASNHLEDGGWLLFEIGHDQGRCVRDMMENAGYGELQVVKDLGGRDRVVLGRRMYRRNRDV